jgi:hypothetical protein
VSGLTRVGSEPWDCACCAGQMIGHRPPAGLCRACLALALTGHDPAATSVLATRLTALAATGPATATTTGRTP